MAKAEINPRQKHLSHIIRPVVKEDVTDGQYGELPFETFKMHKNPQHLMSCFWQFLYKGHLRWFRKLVDLKNRCLSLQN